MKSKKPNSIQAVKKIIFLALVAFSFASCGKSYKAHLIIYNNVVNHYIDADYTSFGIADVKVGDTIDLQDGRIPGKYVIDQTK